MSDTWNGEPWVSSNYRPPAPLPPPPPARIPVRITPLDSLGNPSGPALQFMALKVEMERIGAAFGAALVEPIRTLTEAIVGALSVSWTVATEALLGLWDAFWPDFPIRARRYAIERLGVTEADIREVVLAHDLSSGHVRLWNHRRIPLPDRWWEL